MSGHVLATFVTTTTYGTWLPGDLRGYVEDGNILTAAPNLHAFAVKTLNSTPVMLTPTQQLVAFHAMRAAAAEFGYTLTDVSLESWHAHWIISHDFDAVPTMVGRLKTRIRQTLRFGRVWTDGYCHRCLYTEDEIATARRYIARHAGCRMLDGEIK